MNRKTRTIFQRLTKVLALALFSATVVSLPITQEAEASQNQGLKPYNIIEATRLTNHFDYKSMGDFSYSDVLWMEATGYSRFDPGCGDYTATGEFVRYGIAAVDPNVISLGTSLYIDGYGHAIAADTGGAIQGNKIDLAFESYQDAINWGRRGVNVYIKDV